MKKIGLVLASTLALVGLASCKKSYTVTWKGAGDVTLASQVYVEGSLPEYTGATPTKEDGFEEGVEYTYSFKGWSPNVSLVSGDTVYVAEFSKTALYTITWKDDDGTTLKTTKVKEGKLPEYGVDNPVKASSDRYDYTFKCWSPEIVEATENTSYTAVYTKLDKESKSKWTNDEKTLMKSIFQFDQFVLPFYKSLFEIETASMNTAGYLTVRGGREAEEDELDAYCDLLEQKGYSATSFTNGLGYAACCQMYPNAFETLDDVQEYVKGITTSQGTYFAHQVVAVGIDSEGALTICSTIYNDVYGQYLNGRSCFRLPLQYLWGVCDFTDEETGETYQEGFEIDQYILGNQGDENDIADEFLYPAFNEDQTLFVSGTAYGSICPWTFGNFYSAAYSLWYEFSLFGFEEADYNQYKADLVTAGYVAGEYDAQFKETEFVKTVENVGDFSITLSDWFADYGTIDKKYCGASITVRFFAAEEPVVPEE